MFLSFFFTNGGQWKDCQILILWTGWDLCLAHNDISTNQHNHQFYSKSYAIVLFFGEIVSNQTFRKTIFFIRHIRNSTAYILSSNIKEILKKVLSEHFTKVTARFNVTGFQTKY
jgi:hypothetical protein